MMRFLALVSLMVFASTDGVAAICSEGDDACVRAAEDEEAAAMKTSLLQIHKGAAAAKKQSGEAGVSNNQTKTEAESLTALQRRQTEILSELADIDKEFANMSQNATVESESNKHLIAAKAYGAKLEHGVATYGYCGEGWGDNRGNATTEACDCCGGEVEFAAGDADGLGYTYCWCGTRQCSVVYSCRNARFQ